jgi:phenylalanyl-tRNA synthetase beta chain
MRFTYNWLKDFVDIKIAPRALAEKLTMAGLEVTSLEEKESDFVFEVEITSNRPDWLSVIGIAREVVAITGAHPKPVKPQATGRKSSEKQKLAIVIEDKKDCPLYTGKIIRDCQVGPSPAWLKERLELIGCRSINNVVDITNYVLFTWGEPLHAFDLDKLGGEEIVVRRGKSTEKLVTIDGIERNLSPDILIIADSKKAVAIAGVMGGKDTEVTEGTKNILLEAAVFNGVTVRRGRQKLGLQTDSSYRFERCVDFETAEGSSWQAAKMIEELAAGKCILAKAAGGTKPKAKSIALDLSLVEKILNIRIAPGKIKKILVDLGFKVKTSGKNRFIIGIPMFRPDVSLAEDLIEEIARIHGYETIPQTVPAVRPQIISCQVRDLVSLTKNILKGLGLYEVVTYSLVDRDLLIGFLRDEPQAVAIMNPLSKEQEVLRTCLAPSLARCVAYNLNQKQDYVSVFEIANVFLPCANLPKEELTLGIALSGTKSLLLEQGLVKEEAGYLHLKGAIERLFERLGIKDYDFIPLNAFTIEILANKEKTGAMVKLEKPALDKFDIKNKDVFIAEISLDKLFACVDLKKRFVAPPRYPGICRDISFVLKEDLSVKDILSSLHAKGQPLLCEVKIVDYYKGKQIPAGFRSLTVTCLYRSGERTLTEAEVNPLHAQVLSVLTERFGAKIR